MDLSTNTGHHYDVVAPELALLSPEYKPNPMRNLKLLEKYQPPPPPAIKEKENLSLQENEKTSLLVKVSTTLKLPQPL